MTYACGALVARGCATQWPSRYTALVLRTVLILGLVLLVAFLPMAVAAMPETFTVQAPLSVAAVAALLEAARPTVALLSLRFLRAPPSR